MVRPVFDPMAQDVDYATLGDFTLQTREKLLARWAIRLELQGLDEMLLGRHEESPQLQEVDAELPVVVIRIAQKPADAARNGNRGFGRDVCGNEDVGTPGHVTDDQLFEAALSCIRLHTSASSGAVSSSLAGSSAS